MADFLPFGKRIGFDIWNASDACLNRPDLFKSLEPEKILMENVAHVERDHDARFKSLKMTSIAEPYTRTQQESSADIEDVDGDRVIHTAQSYRFPSTKTSCHLPKPLTM